MAPVVLKVRGRYELDKKGLEQYAVRSAGLRRAINSQARDVEDYVLTHIPFHTGELWESVGSAPVTVLYREGARYGVRIYADAPYAATFEFGRRRPRETQGAHVFGRAVQIFTSTRHHRKRSAV